MSLYHGVENIERQVFAFICFPEKPDASQTEDLLDRYVLSRGLIKWFDEVLEEAVRVVEELELPNVQI